MNVTENTITHLFPGIDLVLRKDPREAEVPGTSLRRNSGGFGDQERPGDASSLRIVLDGYVAMNMLLVGSETGERCQRYTMIQRDVADLDGLEKFRCRGHGSMF